MIINLIPTRSTQKLYYLSRDIETNKLRFFDLYQRAYSAFKPRGWIINMISKIDLLVKSVSIKIPYFEVFLGKLRYCYA